MRVRVVAQNLHSASRGVARALRVRDRAHLRQLVRRLEPLPVDAFDLGAGGSDLSEAAEIDRLIWLAEIVRAESPREIFLDSARPSVLAAAARRIPCSCSFNSIRDLEALSEKELEVMLAGGATVVLQLAPGGRLPSGRDDRLRWAERGLEAAEGRGLGRQRIWIDPVCLPWGDDVEAGRGLLDFLEICAARWSTTPCVLGLSNVSWGHPHRRRLHREWLRRFLDRGLSAVLLDALDEELWSVLRDRPPTR